MRTIIIFLVMCCSCTSIRTIQSNNQDRRTQLDSLSRVMSPEELQVCKNERVVFKVLIVFGIIIIVKETIPLLEYDKQK